MSTENREARAQVLREFLLVKATENLIDDEVFHEALILIKKPLGQLSVAQFKQDQLLTVYQAGDIGKEAFHDAWGKLSLEVRREAEAAKSKQGARRSNVVSQAAPSGSWVPILVVLALGIAGILGWMGFQLWQLKVLNQQEINASRVVQTENPAQAYAAEGFNLASMAKMGVAEYYMSMGKYPNNNQEAGLPAPSDIRGDAVSSVEVGEGGVITVTYNQFVGEGQTLILRPTSSGGGPIVWECKGGTLPAQLRPAHCQ